jgi:hypothetical protein
MSGQPIIPRLCANWGCRFVVQRLNDPPVGAERNGRIKKRTLISVIEIGRNCAPSW